MIEGCIYMLTLHSKNFPCQFATNLCKAVLSAEYFDTYNQIKGLSGEIKLLLLQKDDHIRFLETTVLTTLQRPSFYEPIPLMCKRW